MSCAKRYKNEKRAKEKNRKLKREAKKNPTRHGSKFQWNISKLIVCKHTNFPLESKKDPGIPNSWPFKEQLLNEIEEKKQKIAQEKEEKKQVQRAKKLKAKEASKAESA